MRRGINSALAPALVLFQLSCSIFRPKIAPYPTGAVFPLVEAGRVAYNGKVVRSVRAAEGKVYLTTDKGLLYCLDGVKRTILWEFAAPAPFGCPPLLGPGQIYVWDRANRLYGFDGDGRILWTMEFKETMAGDIAWHQGLIYLGTGEGELLAFNPATKEVTRLFKAGGALEAAPVFWGQAIVLACTDGKVYLLSPDGKPRKIVNAGSPVRVTPLVDGDRLFFGTDDHFFHCYDLKDLRREWRIRIGGKVMSAPKAVGKQVFVLASNSVLYALGKRGDILWWRIIPSRSTFDLEFNPGQVIITSQSSILLCLNLRTGEDIGRYDAGAEIQSNALWLDPDLLVNLYDYQDDKGNLLFLEKEVKVVLSASLIPPQPAGTEIAFSAAAVGFYRPRFEFYLCRNGDDRIIVQKESETNSWAWFPEKEGSYRVGVRVIDEKQSKEAEISFEVVKKTV
jgi:outer membrane protein assembly factor BamB